MCDLQVLEKKTVWFIGARKPGNTRQMNNPPEYNPNTIEKRLKPQNNEFDMHSGSLVIYRYLKRILCGLQVLKKNTVWSIRA